MVEKWANSCDPGDIQDAVDYVEGEGGGTTYLPVHTGIWYDEKVVLTPPPNNKSDIIGSGYLASILKQTKPAPFNEMFYVDGSNGKQTRISGIQFKGYVTSSSDDVSGCAIELDKAIDFRIDHCKFLDFPSKAIYVCNVWTGTTRGVIDHNIIDNPYKDIYGGGMWAYGIVIIGQAYTWDADITHFLGKYETAPLGFPIVYIEDNIISRCRHAISSTQGAWYVARHNTIDEARPKNFGSIDVHGDAGSGAPGGRGLEAYNNNITGSAGYGAAQAFWIRGGGGVIYDNNMDNISYGISLYRGTVEEGLIRTLYIWDNICDGTFLNNDGGYVENTDYFLREPSQAQDGFAYTPYPYPHPLTTGQPYHLLSVNSNPSNIPFTIRRII